MKLNKIKNEIKKYIEENNKKVRWEVRYNNLEKKYNSALQEIEMLKKQLNEDNNIMIIEDKNKYIKTLQKQRDNLRKENLELINRG